MEKREYRMTASLRDLLCDLQKNDCRDAKEHIAFLGELNRQLIRGLGIDPVSPEDRLKLIQHFDYLSQFFEAVITDNYQISL